MSGPAARPGGSDGGQAIVLMALAMAALLLGVGLAIDTGTLFIARRSAQSAADAAAWAGAVVVFRGGTATAAISAARTDATQNGYTDGADSTTVNVVSPPTSGDWVGDTRFVEVTLTRDVRTLFLQGAAAGLTRVQVRAVGGAAPTLEGPAILTLGAGRADFRTVGSAALSVSGADIQINSSDDGAAQVTGGGTVVIASPNVAKVVGGVTGSGFSPAPETGADVVFDPFLAMPEPTSSTGHTVSMPISTDTTLLPGVYANGIRISGGTVTLSAGEYILKDGGFQVTGSGVVSGSGVLIFNTVADHPAATGDCDDISIAGTTTITLSAPTSGIYKGMLLWQDEDCTDAVSLTGTAGLTSLTGTFYTPTAAFNISGNGTADVNINSQIISKELVVSGTAEIVLTYDVNGTAKPLAPALVE